MILAPIIIGFLLIILAIITYTQKLLGEVSAGLLGFLGGFILLIGCTVIIEQEEYNYNKNRMELNAEIKIESKEAPEEMKNK